VLVAHAPNSAMITTHIKSLQVRYNFEHSALLSLSHESKLI